MIDFQDMKHRQEEGLAIIGTLLPDERDILQHYCSLSTEAFLRMGVQRKAPVSQVVMNAYRNGIALGLCLKVTQGEIQGR